MRNLVKKLIPRGLFRAIEPYGHLAEAILANLIYGFPAGGLKVIGVTGTDGKTTTATLITAMLKNAGYKVGMITTISIDLGDGPRPNPTRLTAVTSFELLKNLRVMKKAGVEWLVLETTSHALAQNRYFGVPYTLAVMTNVTHEHLDYHGTFERYRDAKLKLFTRTNANGRGLRAGIVNAEDPSAALFAGAIAHPITYGVSAGDLRAVDIVGGPAGSDFSVEYKGGKISIHINIPGSFNVYNALAGVGAGLAMGLSAEQIRAGLAALPAVEGRMNTIDMGQDFTAIVDYAHTPESFAKIFAEVRPITEKRLIVVFGSAGERDHAKRAIQGETAGRECDVVIATEEDDRSEDGQVILEQIAAGASKSGKVKDRDLFLIHDRAEAIKFAVNMAGEGDTVLALGKGHEKSILTSGGKKPWNEIEAVESAIEEKLDAV